MAVAGLEILKVKNQSGIICRCLIIKVQTKRCYFKLRFCLQSELNQSVKSALFL